jgi:hypothetical protein
MFACPGELLAELLDPARRPLDADRFLALSAADIDLTRADSYA